MDGITKVLPLSIWENKKTQISVLSRQESSASNSKAPYGSFIQIAHTLKTSALHFRNFILRFNKDAHLLLILNLEGANARANCTFNLQCLTITALTYEHILENF